MVHIGSGDWGGRGGEGGGGEVRGGGDQRGLGLAGFGFRAEPAACLYG